MGGTRLHEAAVGSASEQAAAERQGAGRERSEPHVTQSEANVTVHLVDGTYELFRHHFGQPEDVRSRPGTHGAVRGVLWTLYYLLEEGATHVGVATDHV